MWIETGNRAIKFGLPTALFLIVIASIQIVDGATRYVQVTSRVANIRSAPSTRARVVAKARRDDVFQLEGGKGKWYAIHLFSGGSRYLYKSIADPIPYTPEIPEQLSTRREIFKAWQEAQERARREAAQRYPPESNPSRNLQRDQLLNDRYKLKVMHDFEVQPAIHRRIVLEGFQKGW